MGRSVGMQQLFAKNGFSCGRLYACCW